MKPREWIQSAGTAGRHRAPRDKQSGLAFYLFVVLTLVVSAGITIGLARNLTSHQQLDESARESLAQARQLLLAHLAQPDLNPGLNRLGQFSLLPDLPIAVGGATDATEPNYDGLGEIAGCATRIWSTGQPLSAVDTAGASARCFGRIPWKSLGLSLRGNDDADTAGVVPWVIASPNLAISATCLANLNPMMMGQAYGGFTCPSAMPFPWLRVVDARGNLLSDRVAFALVMPGTALPGQTRSPTAPVTAYLDTLTILPGCQPPCQPGTYNNANYAHADNSTWTLIHAPTAGPLINRGTTYQAPVLFNDTVVWVTADELFAFLEARALQTVRTTLDSFRASTGYYPYAAPVGSPTTSCSTGDRVGHPPTDDGDCGVNRSLNLPNWLTASGWQRYFVYAVSPRCVASLAACIAPGLTVDASTNVNAALFLPGQPLTQLPFATSRGMAQQPMDINGVLSTNLADRLDNIENAGGTADVFVMPDSTAVNDNDRMLVFN
ncbi:MAG: hypothetical protein WA888_10925 [Burkholderiaceae bacterium]